MNLQASFDDLRRALESAGILWAIGGSWASSAHGDPRQTNDMDLLANVDPFRVTRFFNALPDAFHRDQDTAEEALRHGRPLNVIDNRWMYKYDLFPVTDDFEYNELERRQWITIEMLCADPVPVVTAEDTILAKMRWYRAGREVSDRQWRDIVGVAQTQATKLDDVYLERWANKLGFADLLRRLKSQI